MLLSRNVQHSSRVTQNHILEDKFNSLCAFECIRARARFEFVLNSVPMVSELQRALSF